MAMSDVLAIVLAVVVFGLMYALIHGIDRV